MYQTTTLGDHNNQKPILTVNRASHRDLVCHSATRVYPYAPDDLLRM